MCCTAVFLRQRLDELEQQQPRNVCCLSATPINRAAEIILEDTLLRKLILVRNIP